MLPQRAFSIEELRNAGQSAAPSNFESLDYEEVENTVYRADQAAASSMDSVAYASLKWTICLLIGECMKFMDAPCVHACIRMCMGVLVSHAVHAGLTAFMPAHMKRI